ncbi:MAG TPA: MqnA/MqnD/SBP family protein [Candidatus Binatia bacterium]|nr:MqnA/MqnD/SBP family protein [Candidatus Binatia bacterium]
MKESQQMTKHTAETFTLGHSPDPDDAFMFYAMAQNKIDLRGYRFEHRLEDIQTLNERAVRGELHISAISIHAYAHVASKYALLPCGASMGDGYGPIVIRKRRNGETANRRIGDLLCNVIPSEVEGPLESSFNISTSKAFGVRESLRGYTIAVPGTMTSAFLALQLFLGEFDYVVVPFDQIFDAVRTGRADVGLIIHEGQLTYEKSGFENIVDLGKCWKEQTGLPLPLGGNVVRKDIPPAVRKDLSEIIRESIDYGLAHREDAVRHSLPYARDMDAKLAGKFIGMYVNEFTRDYGEVGRDAIRRFLAEAHDNGFIDVPVEVEFV